MNETHSASRAELQTFRAQFGALRPFGDLPSRLITVDTIGSTNDLARAAARRANTIVVVVANQQTAGRGRRGRAWHTPPGACLLMSIGALVSTLIDAAWLFGAWAGLAAVEAIQATHALPAALKWPNDLIIDGRKIGGVLVETSLRDDRVDQVVIGLGLNVNVDRTKLAELGPDATSIQAELGHPVTRAELFGAWLHCLARYVIAPANAVAIDPRLHLASEVVASTWRANLATLNRPVTVHESDHRWIGAAVAVAADGALIVRDQTGDCRRVYAADVSLRHADDRERLP